MTLLNQNPIAIWKLKWLFYLNQILEIRIGFEKILRLEASLFLILPNPNPNPEGKPPRPPVRSLYYLTLTLTLEIIIGFENEFGFGNKYLGLNQVRSLYNLTLILTRGQLPVNHKKIRF